MRVRASERRAEMAEWLQRLLCGRDELQGKFGKEFEAVAGQSDEQVRGEYERGHYELADGGGRFELTKAELESRMADDSLPSGRFVQCIAGDVVVKEFERA